ncbi:hypothetical protein SRABI128_03058 [Microbacterium sp. Bi128]|nr:hypothetical protein SRABI128_03058 [Microbacterium sp. Bi128]
MPAPKTPVAKPRRAGSYQALTKGIPTAKTVPATPSSTPAASTRAKESRLPPTATSRIGTMEASRTKVNMARPPYLSVKAPTTIRPSEPTKTGMATSTPVVAGLRCRCWV